MCKGLRDLLADERSEGKAEGKAEIARAMLAKGMDMEVISELTGISIGELKDL